MKKLGLALLILLALTLALASCTMTPAQSTNPPVSGNTSYYVFFEGVEDIPFQTIPENGFATAPEAPEKEGYTFAGWLDEAGNLFNFEETPIMYCLYNALSHDSLSNLHEASNVCTLHVVYIAVSLCAVLHAVLVDILHDRVQTSVNLLLAP